MVSTFPGNRLPAAMSSAVWMHLGTGLEAHPSILRPYCLRSLPNRSASFIPFSVMLTSWGAFAAFEQRTLGMPHHQLDRFMVLLRGSIFPSLANRHPSAQTVIRCQYSFLSGTPIDETVHFARYHLDD